MDVLPLDQKWMSKAACADTDPELFFPVGQAGPALADQAAAREICARCPVTYECREYAMEAGEAAGVWGGLTEEERARKRRPSKRRPAKQRANR